MSQPNPNNTKFEQQRSDAAKASLENQTEYNSNSVDESQQEAENIADNAKDS